MEAIEEKLVDEVLNRRKEYKTDSYSMSIGELTNLYKDGEIKINPDFQRFFRWTNKQKTRFIESILLGIPIPSIFVYQNLKGIWELIDGLQRVSTLLEFMGFLKDDMGKEFPPSILEKINTLPGLEGMTWEKLPQSLRLDIKRAKIKVEIILKDSDKDAKYEVFQRLNTGGSFLTEQEIRNALLIMLDKPMYEWLKELSLDDNFQTCINLSDRLLQSGYDMELVLRYIAFSNFEYTQSDVNEFLTESMKEIVEKQDFNRDEEKRIFLKTFSILNEVFGENVFKKFQNNSFKGGFLISAYEAITNGLRANINSYVLPDDRVILENKVKNLWQENEFISNIGSGSNAKVRLPKIIKFAKGYFAK